MSPKLEKSFNNLLEEYGFIQNNQVAPGLINSEIAKESATTYLRYRGLLKETDVNTDLIYEVPGPVDEIPGTPCIYFKFTKTPPDEMANQLRTKIWNHGRIPTLWIVTPDTVRIYNSFSRPQLDDVKNPRNHLLGELSIIDHELKNIEEFHKSKFDTGEFWRTGQGRKVNPSQRVDSALLSDLTTTERLLVDKKLASTASHALLGRAIFVKYLEDRKIIKPTNFHTYDCSEFKGLLSDKEKTYSFFEWIRATFNGDLFPITPEEKQDVKSEHLDILYRFLSGHDMKAFPNTQPRLWPYSFDIIPIELISSIYEMFAHARDPEKAEAMSIHYTRFNLVELVLSLGMQSIKTTARVLDPACGSGVFLVEAFRRLVWHKEKEYGRSLNREELHQILQNQIFGMDVDTDAVYVAAFSLYLALLELDPDPQPPDALRFPPLLENNQQNGQPPNLYIQDFFNIEHDFNHNYPFSNGGFDLITGNPPWTALKKPKNTENVERQWGLEYCQQENTPDSKPDQAFMWRARTFINSSNPDARVAFIVSSRLFYQISTTAQPWREKFLANNTITQVVNLSDLSSENILFGSESSAGLPASVVIFSPKQPDIKNSVIYVTPKWYPGIRKRDEILITGDDIQILPQHLLKENPLLWKTAFWGTPRDFRLIQRLCSLPTLKKILLDEKIREGRERSRGITFGKIPTKDASQLRDVPFLQSGSYHRYKIDINECVPFDKPLIAEKSNTVKLSLPILILNRALINYRPTVALIESSTNHELEYVIFNQMYYGLSFTHTSSSLAYRLNAILNSRCVYYLTFMLSASLGWDWTTIEAGAWMQIPLPSSIINDSEDSRWRHVLLQEKWLRENWQTHSSDPNISHAEDLINTEVYELYGLSEQEIILVEDTLKYTILPLPQRKKTKGHLQGTEEPTTQQLTKYAQRICTQLNGILHQGNSELAATVFDIQKVPLRACRFILRERSDSPAVISSQVVGIKDIFEQISEHLRTKIADHLYVQRNLRIYDNKTFWIFKPNESRLWSEAAALNDADTVVREHMEQLFND